MNRTAPESPHLIQAPGPQVRARTRRRLVRGVALALVLGAASVIAPAAPAGADESPLCASRPKSQVADVTERLRNWADVATDGHIWAVTDDDVRVRVWKIGTSHFCVRRDIDGTFRSFAGASPNLTGTVSAGVTGTVHGTDWAVMTGDWEPAVPLSGFVGDFDLGCTQDGACVLHRGPGYLFFADDLKALQVRQLDIVYDGGDHGVWRESGDLSVGDIIG